MKKSPTVETKTETLTVRLRPAVKAAATRRAKEDGRSLANYLERLIIADSEKAAKR